MTSQKRGSILRFLGMALPFIAVASMTMAEGPTISGYVETNWIQDLNNPISGQTTLQGYYNDNDGDINSNAHIAIAGPIGDKATYAVEIDAGNEAKLTSADDDIDIQEAYLTYTGDSKLGFKVGKFATFQGIEVLEAPANPTISRGYLYGLAECFTHVGGVATYVLGKLDFAAGVVNGWDLNDDNNDSKTAVWKVGFSGGDPLALTLSGYHGAEQAETDDDLSTALVNENTDTSGNLRSNVDLTGVTKLIPMVDLWFQFNYGQEDAVVDKDGDTVNDDLGKWSGAGIQPIVKFGEKFSIGARAEYFADPDGARTGTDDLTATNFTITPSFAFVPGVIVRAEYRYDRANKKIWVDDKGTMEDTANTVGLQFIGQF